MPDVWGYMRAIRESDLPGHSRLVILTLVSLADPATCVIPDRFQPSLTELAHFTGLGRSTVARVLNAVEESGWVKRDAPSSRAALGEKQRTKYILCLPVPECASPIAGLVPEGDQSQGGTSPGAGPLNTEESDNLTSPGAGLVPERDRTSPGAGHNTYLRTNRTSKTSSSSDKPQKPKKQEPYREDVEQICTHLADRVEANGSPRPKITDDWRREARLLLDEKRDPPITVDKVIALIDWCQNDSFWRGNIRAMPKFRKQYDTLRLKAIDEYAKTQRRADGGGFSRPNQHRTYRDPDDLNVYNQEL